MSARLGTGDSFTVPFASAVNAGVLLFGFNFGAGHENLVSNGDASTDLGAYLASCGPLSLSSANAGPCDVAYLGWPIARIQPSITTSRT